MVERKDFDEIWESLSDDAKEKVALMTAVALRLSAFERELLEVGFPYEEVKEIVDGLELELKMRYREHRDEKRLLKEADELIEEVRKYYGI